MKFIYLQIIFFVLTWSSCNDLKDIPNTTILPETWGESGQMYILSEGLFNLNNSTLSLVNFNKKTIVSDYFLASNGRGLGDTANDMEAYGNYLWIVVNVSSQVEILDLQSGTSVKRIPITDANGKARQPRLIDFYGNKAYVCSFDGTVTRIDINTLTIDKTTTCGRNPDGITIANNKLYVSNSGGLDAPKYDSTVSVIDLDSFKEIKKITVGLNPYKIETDSQGDIYAVVRGNYGNSPAKWCRINSKTDTVDESFVNIAATDFTIHNDTAYIYYSDIATGTNQIKTFDCKTEHLITNNFITDGTSIALPFSINVNSTNGNVYITDAKSYTTKGDLLCFSRQGKLIYKLQNVGLNPNSIIKLQ